MKGKQKAHGVVKRLRDRRRKVRRRLEDIFGRKTVTSIVVLGSMGKLIEVTVVPFIDPASAIPAGRAWAWAFVFSVGLAVSVHWERLTDKAGDVADAVEEATDPEEE